VALPRFLVRLIDPASASFDRRHPRHPGAPAYREAVVFGPGVPGGSRPATDDELARMRTTAARHRADHEAAVADARVRWATELQRAADELLATGSAQLHLGDRTIDARLVGFWRGDDVLHVVTTGPGTSGESIGRLSRKRRSAAALLDQLTHAVARA
jgi:hypothetical protein